MSVFLLLFCAQTLAGVTYVPAYSSYSFDDARRACYRESDATGLPAGRVVGRSMSYNNFYFVVCERELRDYDNTFEPHRYAFVPSVSYNSLREARRGCTRRSSNTGLPAGEHIGYSISKHNFHVVVCKRPLY